MLKTAMTSGLLVLIVATRVASLSHVHTASVASSDHDARPHVHLHSHGDGHGHAGHESHHHHDVPANRSDEVSVRVGEAPHDHDAIYLGDAIAVPADSRTATLDGIDPLVALATAVVDAAAAELSPPEAVAEPPPDPLVFGPALFLRLLSLRN